MLVSLRIFGSFKEIKPNLETCVGFQKNLSVHCSAIVQGAQIRLNLEPKTSDTDQQCYSCLDWGFASWGTVHSGGSLGETQPQRASDEAAC